MSEPIHYSFDDSGDAGGLRGVVRATSLAVKMAIVCWKGNAEIERKLHVRVLREGKPGEWQTVPLKVVLASPFTRLVEDDVALGDLKISRDELFEFDMEFVGVADWQKIVIELRVEFVEEDSST